jgi:hypothetical protein
MSDYFRYPADRCGTVTVMYSDGRAVIYPDVTQYREDISGLPRLLRFKESGGADVAVQILEVISWSIRP